jgi:putative membrane protein
MKRAAILICVLLATASLAAQTTAKPASPLVVPVPPGPSLPTASPAPAVPPTGPAKASILKDETVYAILDPTGAVKSIIVSDWLHSTVPGIEIQDRSNLSSIENIKGYEVPKRVGDALTWKLDGSDLYYRGKSTKSLPMSVTIKYWLDGKQIEPAALVGKSGLVKVRIEVKNLAGADRVIDGVKRRIYAPLIVLVGMDLPVVGFSNIQLTGGKMITDGQNNIAFGLLLPGLAESIAAAGGFGDGGQALASLGIKDLSIPDAFEFTAKVDKFHMGPIFIAATPDFPEIGGPNTVAKLDEALGQFQLLADSSRQIKEGSAALAAGAATLHDAISTALESIKPALASNQGFIDSLSAFIMSDQDVAAARQILDAGGHLANAAPNLVAVINQLLDKKNQQALGRILETAKKLDTKGLLGAPFLGSLISESSLASMAEALAASDELYHGLDEKRLQAAATFAGGATPLFDALENFDETARSYNPSDGIALQAFGGRAAEYEAAAGKMAQLSGYDAGKAAQSLADRSKSDAAYLAATSFLEDPSSAGLQARLASGDALSDADRSALLKLLAASKSERAAATRAAPAEAATAAALPVLADAARLGAAARQASASAAALSSRVIPGLATAREARARTDQIITAGRKVFDPKTVTAITTTVPRMFAVRKAYDKNRATFQAARTFLAIRQKNGSFASQIALLDSIQRDLKDIEPLVLKAQETLASPDISALLGDLKKGDSTQLQSLVVDVSRLQPILESAKALFSPANIAQLRGVVARLPELQAGVDELLAGSSLLAEKMGELATGTKMFDEQGIQQISDFIVDKAKILRGFLKVKDALTALSRDYGSFSGAPDNADTNLKYILRTDELK